MAPGEGDRVKHAGSNRSPGSACRRRRSRPDPARCPRAGSDFRRHRSRSRDPEGRRRRWRSNKRCRESPGSRRGCDSSRRQTRAVEPRSGHYLAKLLALATRERTVFKINILGSEGGGVAKKSKNNPMQYVCQVFNCGKDERFRRGQLTWALRFTSSSASTGGRSGERSCLSNGT